MHWEHVTLGACSFAKGLVQLGPLVYTTQVVVVVVAAGVGTTEAWRLFQTSGRVSRLLLPTPLLPPPTLLPGLLPTPSRGLPIPRWEVHWACYWSHAWPPPLPFPIHCCNRLVTAGLAKGLIETFVMRLMEMKTKVPYSNFSILIVINPILREVADS